MNIDPRIMVGAAVAAVAVSGCTPTDISFGNSVRQTMAAQVVDPDPQYDGPDHTTDAAKTAAAVNRYRTDAVKQPETISTTKSQSGSGGPR
ncbi:hypothetical protein [Sphingopyxis sp. 22461]|uniref:hypothetical protein n=1 Tax=Sphingopyxis sp. 22461 TaxID=3453923 RepID=UPI003F87FE8F